MNCLQRESNIIRNCLKVDEAMKFIAYMFFVIMVLSVVLAPAIELLCLFGDLCKINSALISASRAAVQMAAEDSYVQDAEAVIDRSIFEELFKSSFCAGLELERDLIEPNILNSKDAAKFNNFNVAFTSELLTDSSGNLICDADGNAIVVGSFIEVTTVYKFKTGLLKRFVECINSSKTPIRLRRHQELRLDF